MSHRTWQAIRAEAKAEGVSANSWIVEAAVARLVYARMRRGDGIGEAFDRIFEALRELRDNG